MSPANLDASEKSLSRSASCVNGQVVVALATTEDLLMATDKLSVVELSGKQASPILSWSQLEYL
jgi:hypothetical protein